MSELLPPSIDPIAARRWADLAEGAERAPWLHEEVARRMAERLQVIRMPVSQWAHWEPVRGGMQGHALVARHYPGSDSFLVRANPAAAGTPVEAGRKTFARGLFQRLGRGRASEATGVAPPDASMQMVWANMLAHHSPDPAALMAMWHRALVTDGFVMFSCLGPDTLKELRSMYARLGWAPPSHEFTDMHDWGDLLVSAGFAEPVMDMERVTLTFESPARLLEELRGLGRNLNVARFPALRGRHWFNELQAAMQEHLRLPPQEPGQPPGPLALSFEIIYGHALKPALRPRVAPQTEIALTDMRAALRDRRPS